MKNPLKDSNVDPSDIVSANTGTMSRSLLMLAAVALLVYLACRTPH
jgi:hypothetical protein